MCVKNMNEENKEQRVKEKEIVTIGEGRDEMNLAEFPIALLDSRQKEGIKTIRFQDTIIGDKGGTVTRKWIITGSDEFGLPVEGDEQVYIALMEISKEKNFSSQIVNFTRYELCKKMKWEIDGKSYKRIEAALNRLFSVNIIAENAFWDNENKAYTTEAFHIIDRYTLYDRINKSSNAQLGLALSSIKWNDIIWKSMQKGYIKFLDTKRYFRLDTPLSRRLFRYLDKKFGKKRSFQIDIFLLGYEHLGMSRNYKAKSKLKEKLIPAIEILIKDGYLESYLFRPSQTTSKSEIVEFIKGADKKIDFASENPVIYFYKRLLNSETISRTPSAEENKMVFDFVENHSLDAFKEFVDFVMFEKPRKWPDLATLKGAFNTFLDPFLKELKEKQIKAEKEKKQQEEEEKVQQLYPHWFKYLDKEMKRIKKEYPEDYAVFDKKIKEDSRYQYLLKNSKKGTGPMAQGAKRAMQQEYYWTFANMFRDYDITDFVDWREANEDKILKE